MTAYLLRLELLRFLGLQGQYVKTPLWIQILVLPFLIYNLEYMLSERSQTTDRFESVRSGP
jgi:hypothetical protein